MKYADVIVDISLEALDRVFQYLIPEEIQEKITVGSQVQVPFGRGNRTVKGMWSDSRKPAIMMKAG